MGMLAPTWLGCGETQVTGEGLGTGVVVSRKLTQEESLIFSCQWGASKHASPVVTSECFKSVYFSSSCEISKPSSLETGRSSLQRQAQKVAAAGAELNYLQVPDSEPSS